MAEPPKYFHTERLHNLIAPKEIVPIVNEIVKPRSVLDVGCGLGTFLKVFKDSGLKEIQGIDGIWCNKELLFKNINPQEFQEVDLEKKINLKRKFDLVICLEVAEHLSPIRAESFVEDLTNHGDTILFSAAIPFQGGVNHLNEQWQSYWVKKFQDRGYTLYDVLRPIFWDNKNVFSYYKQNMMLFSKIDLAIDFKKFPENKIIDLVHPDMFIKHIGYQDKKATKRFFKFFLKSLKFRFFKK